MSNLEGRTALDLSGSAPSFHQGWLAKPDIDVTNTVSIKVSEGLLSAVNAAELRHSIFANEYFRHLQDGSMSRLGFQVSQVQFHYAVCFFSRAMAALAARMPDSGKRMALVHNLAEEHGEFDSTRAHDRTFAQFLETIGMNLDQEKTEGPEVSAFNYALLGICSMAEPELALAALGIIEHTFASISALIGEAVVARGWVGRDQLVHYTLHAELDHRHAADFFKEVDSPWMNGGEGRRRVEAGLDLGLHIFDRLYCDLDRLALVEG